MDILSTLGDRLQEINESSRDFSSMTKAQIKSFGTSIGLTLSSSLTKDVMIQTIQASSEFDSFETSRKEEEFIAMTKEVHKQHSNSNI